MSPTPADFAETLLRREREARDLRRRRAKELKGLVLDLVHQELTAKRFERAWLIGSLAWGEHGAGSDVDVVVEGLPADQIGLLWGEWVERLPTSLDLLRIEDISPSFAQRVRTEGVPLS